MYVGLGVLAVIPRNDYHSVFPVVCISGNINFIVYLIVRVVCILPEARQTAVYINGIV